MTLLLLLLSSSYFTNDGGGLQVKGTGELAISMSVLSYARITVDTVEAVSDFKMFSEFMSLDGRSE